MPFIEKYYYPEDNPYKTGDKITWKKDGKIYTVGDDGAELLHWYPNGDSTHIITTCGRVLSINEVYQ